MVKNGFIITVAVVFILLSFGTLAHVYAGITIYFGNRIEVFPDNWPTTSTGHAVANTILQSVYPAASIDKGGWIYNNIPGDPGFGHVEVNCVHRASNQTIWAAK